MMPSARLYLVIAAAASQTRLLDGAPVTGLLAELYESFQAAYLPVREPQPPQDPKTFNGGSCAL